MSESRSSQSLENLQEILDAGTVGDTSLEQYETPIGLARELMGKLPIKHPATIFDPQVASGMLVNCVINGWPAKYGVELDHSKLPGGVQVVTGNCMKVFEAVEDLMPDLRFVVANANPPFGKRWKMRDGQFVDSTLATWNFVTRHAMCGFFIANASTIEKFGINQSTEKTGILFYERRQANRYWNGLRPELQIGVVVWQHASNTETFTPPAALSAFWQQLRNIIDEEKLSRPDYNIYLDDKGFLRTYLSIRDQVKLDKLSQKQ
jgi:predicted RNA methylase